ncbi:hypothetical protein ADK51_08365 [Streptomyces sp. WM6368]|nr:hypothetical protein ADK51_08365 [Streptomyces sp. WM6368]
MTCVSSPPARPSPCAFGSASASERAAPSDSTSPPDRAPAFGASAPVLASARPSFGPRGSATPVRSSARAFGPAGVPESARAFGASAPVWASDRPAFGSLGSATPDRFSARACGPAGVRGPA